MTVLQDALRDAGGGGQTFVRAIKKYVDYYSKRGSASPPEHLIVFDEAQRAHDAERFAHVHKTKVELSEPGHLLRFCERIPRWNVLVALIGTGQAIYVGEEVGVPLWRQAIDAVASSGQWTVHCAPSLADHFEGASCTLRVTPRLNLDTELRFHFTKDVHRFVDGLLADDGPARLRALADSLFASDFRLWITRDLETAKAYLRERYSQAPTVRYGLVASSKDKVLPRFNVDNTFQTTKQLRVGRWYNAVPSDLLSSCQLNTVATEFACQGLELDFALLAWGSDLRRLAGRWSADRSGKYQHPVRDPLGLRKNVYRVLLTRGRDGSVVFVPCTTELDETWRHLLDCGFRELR